MHHTHINTVRLLGEVSETPHWKTAQNGRRLYFIRLATRNGDYKEFHQIMVVDETLATHLNNQRLGEGAVIEVAGTLQYRRKEMAGRTSVYATVVVAKPAGTVTILDAAPKTAGAAA